ncbi:tetratricopeptide repeat protein [Aeromonas jandaei]|uniref:tetratricopeptide repeat protein n=1 Tax=Aeromonas jandaei TaxID=650 RepID=UPI003986EAE3
MKALFLTALLLAAPVWATQERAQELYDLAVVPWEQGTKKGADLMWQAADAGNTDAMCRIASSNMISALVESDISVKYYTMAAEKGALCGMVALSDLGQGAMFSEGLSERKNSAYWTQKSIAVAKQRAEQNDIDAIKTYAFIEATKKDYNSYCKWMEKAANLGDADAMKQLAGHIKDGCGWYLIPGSRKKAVHYWIEQAANHGNPRAMEEMAGFAHDAGDFKGMLVWFDKAIATGNKDSLVFASKFFMGSYSLIFNLPEKYQDPVKAYSFNYILRQYDPKDNAEDLSPYSRLKVLDDKLTKAEKEQAITWAKEWMKNHQVRTYRLVLN